MPTRVSSHGQKLHQKSSSELCQSSQAPMTKSYTTKIEVNYCNEAMQLLRQKKVTMNMPIRVSSHDYANLGKQPWRTSALNAFVPRTGQCSPWKPTQPQPVTCHAGLLLTHQVSSHDQKLHQKSSSELCQSSQAAVTPKK